MKLMKLIFSKIFLFIDRDVSSLCRELVNISSANIKLSKIKLSKIIQPGRFLD